MFTNKIRRFTVALGLVAVAAVTGASAAGFAHRTATPVPSERLPVPSGDLGEVIVHAPHDLAALLLTVDREPVEGAYLAHVIVTVPREAGAVYSDATEAVATLAVVE